MLFATTTSVPVPQLRDTTVAGIDVNMVLFLFGLAGAAAFVTFALVHNPRAFQLRAKHRF